MHCESTEQLMEEDGWADDKLQAVHYTLERLMLAVLKDMNKQTRVNTLSTLISLPPNNKVYSAQTNDQEYEVIICFRFSATSCVTHFVCVAFPRWQSF